jgi:hypothetical protein
MHSFDRACVYYNDAEITNDPSDNCGYTNWGASRWVPGTGGR